MIQYKLTGGMKMIVLPDWVAASLLTWALTALWFKRHEIHNWFGV